MGRLDLCARRLVVGVALATAGCNLTNTDPPEDAHFKLEADKTVMLITSTEFIMGGTEVTLVEADTFTVSAKEATIDLPSPPRFFIRAIALQSGTSVLMKVDVGKRNWYDNTRTIAPPERLEFVYGYTGSTF